MKQSSAASSIPDSFTNTFFKTLSLTTLSLTAIVLIALQQQLIGWIFFAAGVLFTLFSEKTFRDHILLIYGSLFFLGLTPISTNISYQHMLVMGMFLILAVLFPYLASRFAYQDHVIRYKWHAKNAWNNKSILYIVIAVPVVCAALPYLLYTTNSYLNWTVAPGMEYLTTLFIGTNALGIWDELFFINTVFVLLRRHVNFIFANLIQGILFTSFLYELGFQGFMFVFIFLFALVQGYIFKKTESLLYVIVVHLLFDLILYITLLYLHYPSWFAFSIT